MRSRRDDVDHGRAVERALAEGLCGMGGRLPRPPESLEEAVEALGVHDERAARRLARFAEVAPGAFVWTRDVDGLHLLGRLTGGWRYDASAEASRVDLVHVRDCAWRQEPVMAQEVPPAVLHTFARGGRNFQQIHDAAVSRQSLALWEASG